jgi:hypothetical protein
VVKSCNIAKVIIASRVTYGEYRIQSPTAYAQGAKECYARCGLQYFTNQAGGGPLAAALAGGNELVIANSTEPAQPSFGGGMT